MNTIIKRKICHLLMLLTAVACSDKDEPVAERKLGEFMKFTGEAEGTDEGVTINCVCDLNLELPEFETTAEGTQQFSGSLGGEIIRAVTKDSGDGFSFAPFLFGDVTVTVKQNDSIYLSWPGNLGTGIRFYDEIALFKGVLNRNDGTVRGTWMCAPLELDEGGYVDLHGTVEGNWGLEEFD